MQWTRIEIRRGDRLIILIRHEAVPDKVWVTVGHWLNPEAVDPLLAGYFTANTVAEGLGVAAKILGACDGVCYDPYLFSLGSPLNAEATVLVEAIAKILNP